MGETDDLEWDDTKDAANQQKHGLPLLFAHVVFDGRKRLERLSPKPLGEARFEMMAEVDGRVLSASTSGAAIESGSYPCAGRTGASSVPTRKQREKAERLLATFDWSKVDALTDAEIIAAAKADPDSALPSDAELAGFDLVIPARSRRKPRKEAAE